MKAVAFPASTFTILPVDLAERSEAKNAGEHSRTVLLFEIWRPEIAEDERAQLARIFEAIGDFSE